jgi:hypothetical protein
MDEDANAKAHAAIMARLQLEEKDHARIILRLEALEEQVRPLTDIIPILEDFAATGRIGRMFGKLTLAIAGFLAAIAGIWYSIVHGFQK